MLAEEPRLQKLIEWSVVDHMSSCESTEQRRQFEYMLKSCPSLEKLTLTVQLFGEEDIYDASEWTALSTTFLALQREFGRVELGIRLQQF